MFCLRSSTTFSRLKFHYRLHLLSHFTSTPLSTTTPYLDDALSPFLHHSPANPFSTTSASDQPADFQPDSPELPGWHDNCASFYHESDDDFGIPQVSDWAARHQQQPQLCKTDGRFASEVVVQDADEVSEVLRFRYESPDDAAQAIYDKCGGISLSEELLSKLLSRFGNDYVRAFGVFKWAKMHPVYEISACLCNQMVDILGKCRLFDEMWELVDEMNQSGRGLVTLVTMTKVIRRLAKAGEFDEAIGAFMRIERFGVKRDIDAMNMLLDPLVRGASIETATSVFSKFENEMQPTLQTYNIFIHGWCKARKIDRAYEVLKKMEQSGISPDTTTYNSFVEYYCRGKDFQKVEDIINDMHQKGCPPSVTTYTIYVQALGKSKELTKALLVRERMNIEGCDPDAMFYSALISLLGRSGRLDDALALYREMMKQGIKPILMTCNSLITLYCLNSREGDAVKLLLEMKKNLVKPDVMTYEPLLKMCCKRKQMKVLAFLWDHMSKSDKWFCLDIHL
uniref:Pentatricopeptide repeat-containing protein n=1 Tax=Kalanchoe fedtschenkoi TaxID=63787 RepID=A0A7N0VL96_KALFE